MRVPATNKVEHHAAGEPQGQLVVALVGREEVDAGNDVHDHWAGVILEHQSSGPAELKAAADSEAVRLARVRRAG
ncbi:MAG: hypothetical protein AAF938_09495 [Myxococcota bacterium]